MGLIMVRVQNTLLVLCYGCVDGKNEEDKSSLNLDIYLLNFSFNHVTSTFPILSNMPLSPAWNNSSYFMLFFSLHHSDLHQYLDSIPQNTIIGLLRHPPASRNLRRRTITPPLTKTVRPSLFLLSSLPKHYRTPY